MSALVPVPWQPHLFLTPDTLALLVAAGEKLGKPLHIVGNDGAWREYAKQKYYYDGWVARKPGFNVASNPDTGQRSHMRGAAFDLINTDAATQAACRAVGLIRDPVESWHWNNPRWASMPIIKANTATAGGSIGVPIPAAIELKDEDMPIKIEVTDSDHVYLIKGDDVTLLNGEENAAWEGLIPVYAKSEAQMAQIKTSLRRDSALAVHESSSVTRQRQVTDGLDSMVNRDQHSLKVIHEAVSAVKPSTVGGVAIDYDILASKVADKLAARLVS